MKTTKFLIALSIVFIVNHSLAQGPTKGISIPSLGGMQAGEVNP